jgi:hypothetical protein
VLLNPDPAPVVLGLPPATYSFRWTPILSTESPGGVPAAGEQSSPQPLSVPVRSVLVLTGPPHGRLGSALAGGQPR